MTPSIKANSKLITNANDNSKFNDLIFILNPNSQGGNTGKNWDETYSKIKEFLPIKHKIIFTKKANDGTLMTRKLLKEGYKNIVAVGGDGTINEIANGFFYNRSSKNNSVTSSSGFKPTSHLKAVNPDGVLHIIPSGSRNVLAASLRLQYEGIDSFMHINEMKKSKIDVIGVTTADKDDPTLTRNRIVLNAAEIGVGAEIINRSKKVRAKVKSRLLSTVAGIISTVPTYESNSCEIILDNDKTISPSLTMGIIANGQFLGGGFNAAPKASMSDGLMDLVILKDSGSLKMLEKLVNLKGDDSYTGEDNILYYQVSQVTILPKERNMTVSLDGEPIGILPASFKVYHNALSLKANIQDSVNNNENQK
ncbi:MAG TPA: diacylglycerol kinase family protein [Nitrososphaeraceae archaeon]|nr:diacylglycerol kinase family protein [Nitrososphaeraceae archaeon]